MPGNPEAGGFHFPRGGGELTGGGLIQLFGSNTAGTDKNQDKKNKTWDGIRLHHNAILSHLFYLLQPVKGQYGHKVRDAGQNENRIKSKILSDNDRQNRSQDAKPAI